MEKVTAADPRRKRRAAAGMCTALVSALLCGAIAFGSFGRDGKTTLRFGGTVDQALVGRDGRLLLLVHNFRGRGKGMVRLRQNGTVDRGFGDHGFAAANWNDAVVQRNGRIVGVTPGTPVSVGRLQPNGLPDRSFGRRGTATVRFGRSIEEGTAIATAPEGKILVGGSSATYAVPRGGTDQVGVVARLNSDGSQDSTFSRDGVVTLNRTGSVDALSSHRGGVLAFVVYGRAGLPEIRRLRSGGAPDRSFGRGGELPIRWDLSRFRYFAPIQHIGILADGRFVLVGTTTDEGTGQENFHGLAVRYLPNGKLDRSYGVRGHAEFGFRGVRFTFPSEFVIGRRGGLVVAAGLIDSATGRHLFGAIALNSRGARSRRFARAGQAWTRFPGNDWVKDIAVQAAHGGQRAVLVGWSGPVRGTLTVLARVPLVHRTRAAQE